MRMIVVRIMMIMILCEYNVNNSNDDLTPASIQASTIVSSATRASELPPSSSSIMSARTLGMSSEGQKIFTQLKKTVVQPVKTNPI